MNESNKKGNVQITTHHTKDPFYLMHRAFDNALDNFFGRYTPQTLMSQDWENFLITPAVDVVDEKDQIKIEAEMPGMGPEDITLSISDGMLTIKGEKTTAKKDKGKDYLKREINYGSYMRTIPLPETVDIDKSSASFKKGMLWVTLPKKSNTSPKTRQLKIEEV